jgi:hypothetical protein
LSKWDIAFKFWEIPQFKRNPIKLSLRPLREKMQNNLDFYEETFSNVDTDLIKEIIDTNIPCSFIPGLRLGEYNKWNNTDILVNKNSLLINNQTRNISLDLMIDTGELICCLDKLLHLQLSIFQFTKTIPETLKIERINSGHLWDIFVKNGCMHNIWINYEFVTIKTIDKEYFSKVKNILSKNI